MKNKLITTVFVGDQPMERVTELVFVPDNGAEKEVINIYSQRKFQQFDGFGGAFTDSAGYVFSLMDEKDQQTLLESYFGEDNGRYTIGRVHLDSCDFSLQHYQAVSNEKDTKFSSFSLDGTEKHILPFLRRAQEVYGKEIPLMVAPWSPPDFMKDTKKRNNGGRLMPEYYATYASYLCAYIKALENAGAKISAMTLQNEPKAVQTWDSCIFTPEEEKNFIKKHLAPTLKQNGIDHIEIFIWDHNKERLFDRAETILDKETLPLVSGAAFHWYSGDHFDAVDLVHEAWPDLKLVQSEACIEYVHFQGSNGLEHAQKYAHNIIGDLNAGMTGFYDWNLVLDEEGGPNHVGNFCEAPFLYDTKARVLKQQPSFSYIKHFSQYIVPGSRRVGVTKFSEELKVTAFQRPDGTIAFVIMNTQKQSFNIWLRYNGQMVEITLEPESICTGII